MPTSVLQRDASDPRWRAVELVQRGRMILDIAQADLDTATARLGAAHPTCWHFRQGLDEARRSWDRLRAQFGGKALEAALDEPPLAVLRLNPRGGRTDDPTGITLIPISGRTFRVEPIEGTPLAPIQWRLTRLSPILEHGPYYACRLGDGSTQCDCAEWFYREDAPTAPDYCKHLAALAALGWI